MEYNIFRRYWAAAQRVNSDFGGYFSTGEYYIETAITEFDLKIRYQIYRFIAVTCKTASHQEIAGLLKAAEEDVRDLFYKLHERHMVFFGA